MLKNRAKYKKELFPHLSSEYWVFFHLKNYVCQMCWLFPLKTQKTALAFEWWLLTANISVIWLCQKQYLVFSCGIFLSSWFFSFNILIYLTLKYSNNADLSMSTKQGYFLSFYGIFSAIFVFAYLATTLLGTIFNYIFAIYFITQFNYLL